MIQDYNEYKLSNKERLALVMVSVGFLLLAGMLYINSIITVVISPIAYGFASQRYMSYMIAKRRTRLRNEFKELLYSFSASFAIGSSMKSAMKDGCKKLREIFDDDSIMLGELEGMCSKLESTASDPVFLWEDLASRCVVEDIKLFSEVYRGCTSSGGDMIVAIEAAAKTIGEKIEMENSIKLLAKQKIIEGRVIAVIPVIIILFLRICSPGYIKPMYEGIGGKIIMMLALSISVTAIFLSERICKIEV